MFKKLGPLAAAAFLFCFISNAHAVSVTYTLTGSSGTNGPAGNVRTFNSSGYSVDVTAWSNNGGGGDIVAAFLGAYGGGLGVTNTGSDGQHTVDNSGFKDFIFFDLNGLASLTSVRLTAFGDTDIRAWIGNSNTFSGGYGDLGADGFTFLGNNNGGNSNRWANYNSNVLGNYIIIAAKNSGNNSSNDSFKLKKLKVEYADVPEPSTVGLLLAGLLGLVGLRKRQAV